MSGFNANSAAMPPRPINATEVLQAALDQTWTEALQTAARLIIKRTGKPNDALRTGVRDRIVIEGEKHARAIRKLVRGPKAPHPPSSAKLHPSVRSNPVLDLLREARDSMVDFGPRGTQVEIIADIDKILARGVAA